MELLATWERWSAEILESHISYPILCFYRSQHDNQSWLSAMTAVLDSCALLIAVVQGPATRQAQLTFAMGRHALIDLGHVFHLEERGRQLLQQGETNRLTPESFAEICRVLGEAGVRLCGDDAAARRLQAMRLLYEPYACALADYLGMDLAGWVAEPNAKDQWVTISKLREQAEAVLVQRTPVSDETAGRLLEDEVGEH